MGDRPYLVVDTGGLETAAREAGGDLAEIAVPSASARTIAIVGTSLAGLRAGNERPSEESVRLPKQQPARKQPIRPKNSPMATPIIVKYRDEKTDRGIELEDWLR